MSNNNSKKNNGMDEDSITKIDDDESSETVINSNLYNQNEGINVIHGPEQNRIHENPFSIRNENQQNNPTYSAFRSQNGSNHINQTMVNRRLPNQDILREVQPRIRRMNSNGANVQFNYVIHRSPIDIPEQIILSPTLYDAILNGRKRIVISSNQIGIINQQPNRRMSFNVYTIPPLSELPPPTRTIPSRPPPLASTTELRNVRNLNRLPLPINRTRYNTVNPTVNPNNNPNNNHNVNNNTNTTINNTINNQRTNNKQNNTK